MKLTVKEIINVCDGSLICGNENVLIENYSKDTRTIKNGDCYIGIKGENFDGNKFWQDAVAKGAGACILDSFSGKLDDDFNIPIILVKNTVIAIQQLAAYVRNKLNIPVIAVTGSVGKTSTKDLIASVLEQKYKVLKSPGNLNGQIGLPLNILSYKDEDIMVLEMGMNDFGQIATLSKIAKPTIAVITNIGTAHIGILGSRENILKAKLEILEGMDINSPVIINYDNDLLHDLKLPNLVKCGTNHDSTYQALNINVLPNKTSYNLNYKNNQIAITLPIMGEAFVLNSLLAVAVGDILNLTVEEIKKGLENYNNSSSHLNIFNLKNNITLIDDTYNSNLEAVKNALQTLLKYPGKRHIAVLGDILEMNDFAKEIHEKIGELEEVKKLDALFLTGDNSRFIKNKASMNENLKDKIFYFNNKEELQESLKSYLTFDDTILIKASNGMHFNTITEFIKREWT